MRTEQVCVRKMGRRKGAVSTNSSEPLVIIDGVAYESINDMRLLNPSDIESMSFLKDGAAAIYGSRAAGGVVLITTKFTDVADFVFDDSVDWLGSLFGNAHSTTQGGISAVSGDISIKCDGPATAAVTVSGEEIRYMSDRPCTVRAGKKKYRLPASDFQKIMIRE